MIRFIMVMVPLVFLINAGTKLDWHAGPFLSKENLDVLSGAFFSPSP